MYGKKQRRTIGMLPIIIKCVTYGECGDLYTVQLIVCHSSFQERLLISAALNFTYLIISWWATIYSVESMSSAESLDPVLGQSLPVIPEINFSQVFSKPQTAIVCTACHGVLYYLL